MTMSPDVVVVGGGIVGAATALQLQRGGRTVMVVERGIPGNEASGHNGGQFSGDCMPVGTPGVLKSLPKLLTDPESALILRKRYVPRLTPWLIRFALASLRVESVSTALNALMSRGFDAYRPLVAGTAVADVISNRGSLYGYLDRKTLDGERESYEIRNRRGVPYEVLSEEALVRIDPAYAGRFRAAVYFPNAYYTKDPQAFTQALLDDLVARGGSLRRAEVTGFATSDRRVTRVRTSAGEITTGAVVIAAGPWSRTLLRSLGTDVPLDVERGYGADLPRPGLHLEVPIVVPDVHVSLAPHRGGIRVTGINELASISAPADPHVHDRLLKTTRRTFPELRTEGAELWMHRRPSTPDSLPIIGRAPRAENAYLAFGHAHKGLCMGAITGQLVQQLMDGAPTTVDITPYSPTRFALRPGPTTAARASTAS